MSYFKAVAQFHREILNLQDTPPCMLSNGLMQERIDFLCEELDELMQAQFDADIVGVSDALADLVYVALGTAYQMGLPFDEIWAAVQSANMRKVRGTTKRGNAVDATKPVGWVGPEAKILEAINAAILG